MLMESLALLLYKNLTITWLSVCEEQMHSLLFHKAYQGHATERSNKDRPFYSTTDTAFILCCDVYN